MSTQAFQLQELKMVQAWPEPKSTVLWLLFQADILLTHRNQKIHSEFPRPTPRATLHPSHYKET